LSVLVYVTIIALVAFVLFHQRIVKQRATEMAPLSPGSISFADTPNSDAIYNPAPLQPDRSRNRQKSQIVNLPFANSTACVSSPSPRMKYKSPILIGNLSSYYANTIEIGAGIVGAARR